MARLAFLEGPGAVCLFQKHLKDLSSVVAIVEQKRSTFRHIDDEELVQLAATMKFFIAELVAQSERRAFINNSRAVVEVLSSLSRR